MDSRFDPYRPRLIRYLDLWQVREWRMKAYIIAYRPVGGDLIQAGRRITEERLAAVPPDMNHYGVGFVGIHQGKTGSFVFVDWWADENELHHHVYTSTLEHPNDLVYRTPEGLAACVWDLALIGFERQAWVDRVLSPGSPDPERYLQTRMNADV